LRRKSRYNPTIGKLLFVIPVIVIIAVGVYAFVQLNTPGTLVVRAEDQNQKQLSAEFTVNGHQYVTPAKISLPAGSYTVDFYTLTWYYPPSTQDVTVRPGQTIYAGASYVPQVMFVQVTTTGFNTTSISALHGVTPVVWKNPSGATVDFTSGPFKGLYLNAGQSYSYTFSTAGKYAIMISSSNSTLDVQVE
jgi:hypothetical protein